MRTRPLFQPTYMPRCHRSSKRTWSVQGPCRWSWRRTPCPSRHPCRSGLKRKLPVQGLLQLNDIIPGKSINLLVNDLFSFYSVILQLELFVFCIRSIKEFFKKKIGTVKLLFWYLNYYHIRGSWTPFWACVNLFNTVYFLLKQQQHAQKFMFTVSIRKSLCLLFSLHAFGAIYLSLFCCHAIWIEHLSLLQIAKALSSLENGDEQPDWPHSHECMECCHACAGFVMNTTSLLLRLLTRAFIYFYFMPRAIF